ncbi:MAG: hypothetical protein BRC41_18980 [Cyanobacteria bacterium QH_9_48_43]|nr:MAG: hypothetical protein BRC41_18980 [Cyanobacteria bacterium QH_9_48_43]
MGKVHFCQYSYKSAKTYRLSKEAFSLFRKAYDRYEELRCDPSTPTAMSSVWGKSEGRVGKIALNLHLIKHAFHHSETVPEEIDAETMRSAIELTEFYANQVKALYNELETGSSLSPILAKVVSVAQKKGDWTTARDIRNKLSKQQAKTFTPEKIRWFFSELAEKGYGRVTGEGRTLKFMSCSDGSASSSDKQAKVLKVPDGSSTISQNSHLQENTEYCGGSDGCDGSPQTNFSINGNNCESDVERTCTTSKTFTLAQNSVEEGNISDGSKPSKNFHFNHHLNHQQQAKEGAGDKQASGEDKAIEDCKMILESLLANGIEPTPENLANYLGISLREVKEKQYVFDNALAELS